MRKPLTQCRTPNCKQQVPGGFGLGVVFCEACLSDHVFANKGAIREAVFESRLYPTRAPRLCDQADDWRAQVVKRAVPSSRAQIFCDEKLTWRRIRGRTSKPREYIPDVPTPDDGLWPIEYEVNYLELMATVKAALATLTPKESAVLMMRYGLHGTSQWLNKDQLDLEDCDLSLGTIAEFFNLTKERIRQIEGMALRKLRHPTTSKHLKPFLSDGASRGSSGDELPIRNLKVIRLQAKKKVSLPREVQEFCNKFPIPEETENEKLSLWFLTWTGGLTPRGALLRSWFDRVAKTENGVVTNEAKQEIGHYIRFGATFGHERERQMLILLNDK